MAGNGTAIAVLGRFHPAAWVPKGVPIGWSIVCSEP